jgi:hypothetical protein
LIFVRQFHVGAGDRCTGGIEQRSRDVTEHLQLLLC